MEQQISQLKQQLAYMRTPEMQRQLKQALSVVLLSFNSMRRACLHPYVQVSACAQHVKLLGRVGLTDYPYAGQGQDVLQACAGGGCGCAALKQPTSQQARTF